MNVFLIKTNHYDFPFLGWHIRNLEAIVPLLTTTKSLNKLKINSSSQIHQGLEVTRQSSAPKVTSGVDRQVGRSTGSPSRRPGACAEAGLARGCQRARGTSLRVKNSRGAQSRRPRKSCLREVDQVLMVKVRGPLAYPHLARLSAAGGLRSHFETHQSILSSSTRLGLQGKA